MKRYLACVLAFAAAPFGLPPLATNNGFIGDAVAQAVQRCVGPDGTAVFTDRSCAEMGATASMPPPPPAGSTASASSAPKSCARTSDELLVYLRMAVSSGDANRVAALFDWRGYSGNGSKYVMDRMESLVATPVISVEFVHSASLSEDELLAEEAKLLPPDTIKVEHTSSNGVGSRTTLFNIGKSAGCYWIRN